MRAISKGWTVQRETIQSVCMTPRWYLSRRCEILLELEWMAVYGGRRSPLGLDETFDCRQSIRGNVHRIRIRFNDPWRFYKSNDCYDISDCYSFVFCL